jgi:hypothetical protein
MIEKAALRGEINESQLCSNIQCGREKSVHMRILLRTCCCIQ